MRRSLHLRKKRRRKKKKKKSHLLLNCSSLMVQNSSENSTNESDIQQNVQVWTPSNSGLGIWVCEWASATNDPTILHQKTAVVRNLINQANFVISTPHHMKLVIFAGWWRVWQDNEPVVRRQVVDTSPLVTEFYSQVRRCWPHTWLYILYGADSGHWCVFRHYILFSSAWYDNYTVFHDQDVLGKLADL